jgi:hypothetical protein
LKDGLRSIDEDVVDGVKAEFSGNFLNSNQKKNCVAGEYRLMSQPRGDDSADDSPHNNIPYEGTQTKDRWEGTERDEVEYRIYPWTMDADSCRREKRMKLL